MPAAMRLLPPPASAYLRLSAVNLRWYPTTASLALSFLLVSAKALPSSYCFCFAVLKTLLYDALNAAPITTLTVRALDMDEFFHKCEILIYDKLTDGKIILPAGLYIGHLLTALFYVFTTGDLALVVLGTLFFGWFTSILVWLAWTVIIFALTFCLAVVYAIVLILALPIAGTRQRLRQ